MNKGGISIREFEKSFENPDEKFRKACEIYKSRIKNDNDAKEHSNLYDLNPFKGKANEFVFLVDVALNFIENRKRGKALRRGKKVKGIEVLYDDEKCFIVRPLDKEHSHVAAYLDNGTASWCVASKVTPNPPEGRPLGEGFDNVQHAWDLYGTNTIFYIYFKGKDKKERDSWAVLFNDLSIYRNKVGLDEKLLPFRLIEDRENRTGDDENAKKECYEKMLQKTGLTDEKFRGIVKKYAERANIDYKQMVSSAAWDDDLNTVKAVLEEPELVKLQLSDEFNLLDAFTVKGNVEALEYLVDEKNFRFMPEGCKADNPPFMNCHLEKHKKCLDFYLERGLDINYKTVPEGSTLLWKAVHGGDMEFIKYVVEKGGDINYKKKLKHEVMDFGEVTKVEEHDFNLHYPALVNPRVERKTDAVKYLASLGVPLLNESEWANRSVFSRVAALSCYDYGIELLNYFIENGYDIEKYGDAALTEITYYGMWHRPEEIEKWELADSRRTIDERYEKYTKVMEFLLEKGAKNVIDYYTKKSPLDSLIQHNHCKAAKLFLERGMRPLVPVYKKMTKEFRSGLKQDNGEYIIDTRTHEMSDEMQKLLKEYEIEILPEGVIQKYEKPKPNAENTGV